MAGGTMEAITPARKEKGNKEKTKGRGIGDWNFSANLCDWP